MTGDQFIDVAGKIAATYSDPASCRTAISRAYYGGFHLAKVFLDEMGVRPPKNANAHVFIRQRLFNCGHKDAETVGALLWDLYADRLKADYDLDNANVEAVAYARTCVETARELESPLASCQPDASRARIKAGIDNYEKRISRSG